MSRAAAGQPTSVRSRMVVTRFDESSADGVNALRNAFERMKSSSAAMIVTSGMRFGPT
jgi:hypothetical protein